MVRYPIPLATLFLATAALAQHEHGGHGTAPETARRGPPAASQGWTRQPLLLPVMGNRGERASASLRLQGLAAPVLTVYAPDGPAERRQVDYPVQGEGARIASAAPEIGNYHWVVARAESDAEVRVASTAWYFGNPGPSPARLLQTVKHELEIVPEPLPREHGAYRESEKWRFLVRFQGAPLAGQPVVLETEFGSRSTFVTGADGHATVLFPRDHRPVAEGAADGHGPRRAKFVLTAEREQDGRRYLTGFNLQYGADADRDRSLGWGAAFGLLGMVAAVPLLRRRAASEKEASHA
jgi:hypothetical protein